MAKWSRPSGTEIETNDSIETVKYCESLGWVLAGSPKVKRKRRTKEEMANDNSGAGTEGDTTGHSGTG